jgi:hypothetical protein
LARDILLTKEKGEKRMSEEYRIQRVDFYNNPGAVEEVLLLQQFVPEYLREDREGIEFNLSDTRNIHLLMRNQKGEVICYAFATPQDELLVGEYSNDDPLMSIDPERYYVDQVVAADKSRKGFSFFSDIVHAIFKEANKMGIFKFSVHALCENGVDRIIARVFRKGIYLHRNVVLQSWGGRNYRYMEAFFGPERRKITRIPWTIEERRKMSIRP